MNITSEHLARQVKQLCERWPDTQIVAVHAEQWQGEDVIDLGKRTFRIVWCVSALSVSEELAALKQDDRLIVLTPLTDADLSLDVRARFVRQRLIHPEQWQMVRDTYGVMSVDHRLPSESWIADALLAARHAKHSTPVNVLDADTAWAHLFGYYLGLPDGTPDADAIVRWSMEPGAARRFGALHDSLADAVATRFANTAGTLGQLLTGAISAGNADELLPIGLACQVLFDGVGEGGTLLVQATRLEPLLDGSSIEPEDGKQWAAVARRVLLTMPQADRQEWLLRAERLLARLQAQEFAERSDVLPSGFRQRLMRFATTGMAAMETPDAAQRCEDAFERLMQHDACNYELDRLRHFEMAMRVLRRLNLLRQNDRRGQRSTSLATMVAQHVNEGGFEDWARRHLLDSDEQIEISHLYGALYKALRKHREADNHAFAKLVRDWLVRNHPTDVVPIEHCLARIVAPLVESCPVLLLVLDAMDGGTFEELSDSLDSRGWQRWQTRGTPQAMLAVLPTVTESSRMALLSGEVKRGNLGVEKIAFATHPDLLAVSRTRQPPLLFHKGDLTDLTADLAQPVRKALVDDRQRIVGIVLNAVDDHLAKSEQLQLTWRVESIRLLPAILSEARAIGRAVILVADHGHVLEAGGVKLAGDSQGRWRRADEPATKLEIELQGTRIFAATGHDRVVLPWSETVRYGHKKNGYHGGVTMQETVVPVGVFLGPGETLLGWEPARPSYPSWWSPAR